MVLDDKSIKILHCFDKQNEPLSIIQLMIFTSFEYADISERIDYFLRKKLIRIDQSASPEDASFQMTLKGKIALEKYLKENQRFFFNEFRAWITLFVAIAAFILSVISLLLQYI